MMKWFYLFFIFAVTSLPNFRIGPMSVRIYMTTLMMLFLLKNAGDIHIEKEKMKYVTLYVTFMLFMTLAMLANGEIFEMNYINYLLGSHIPPMVTFIATFYFVKKEKDFDTILIPIGITTIITSFVTCLQFYNIPLGWTMNFAFNSGGASEWQEYIIDRYSGQESMMGLSYQTGIYGFSFTNAAFLCSTSVLFLRLVVDRKRKHYIRFISFVIFMASLTACFMTQQRAAFLGSIILSLIILYKSILNGFVRVLITLISILFVFYGGLNLLDSDSLGRMAEFNGMENDSRYNIWVKSLDFLSENILWGGPLAEIKYVGVETHNVFMNAFVYGGLIGGVVIIALLLRCCILALTTFMKYINSQASPLFYACGFLLYTATSLFHNCSIVNGSELTFLMLALLLISVRNLTTK